MLQSAPDRLLSRLDSIGTNGAVHAIADNGRVPLFILWKCLRLKLLGDSIKRNQAASTSPIPTVFLKNNIFHLPKTVAMKLAFAFLSLGLALGAVGSPLPNAEALPVDKRGYSDYGNYGNYGKYGKYASYGTYPRSAEPEAEAEADAAAVDRRGGYGNYGNYGQYGKYGSYGTYPKLSGRNAEAEAEAEAEADADLAALLDAVYLIKAKRGDYGNYGAYGKYGKYGSYGSYSRAAEPEPEAEPET